MAAITSSVMACMLELSVGRPVKSIGLPNRMVTFLPSQGMCEPIGCTASVPSTPTGMIGTSASSASRAAPVRPR